ncbi:MAG: DNA polymerase III subunit beta [Deltaproteobacteria bacterium]|nr:DNA polymerase III subunit beta [Deltaproteobacteria bacterium]
MEIKVDRETLLKAISRVQGILEKRSHMPILSTVLLTTKGNDLELSATDLEIGFQNTYPAEVIQPGSITLSGKKLLDITRETNSPNIYISEKENNWVYISDGNAHYNLSCLPSDEFPVLTEPEGTIMINLDGKVLSEMITKTIYSVTLEEAGFKLSGVFMEKVEKQGQEFLRMTATDGHRLSLIDKKVPDVEKIEIVSGVMIPKKGMVELNKLSSEEESVLIGFKQNNLVAKKGKALIIIRLLETKFPDYKNVIPVIGEDEKNVISIDKQLLLNAMRRMMIIRSDQYQGMKMSVGADYLEMTSVNPDLGNVEEKVEIKYAGEPIEVGFNPKYFIDVLQPMDSDTVYLTIKEQTGPCLITGDQDDGFLGLIMPMRL